MGSSKVHFMAKIYIFGLPEIIELNNFFFYTTICVEFETLYSINNNFIKQYIYLNIRYSIENSSNWYLNKEIFNESQHKIHSR